MKPILKYLFIFFSAFAATGIGTYIAVILVSSNSKEVVLPDLKGKNIIYVLETLTALDLNPRLYGTEYNKQCPRYHVISQDPEPGSVIKKGRDVIIYISKGKKLISVPDLRHMSINDAKILIENNELQTGFISKTFSKNMPKNQILSQNPDAYSDQVRHSKVNLLVSAGKKMQKYAMPDLYALPLGNAKNIMNTNKLNIAEIGSDNLITLPHNVIIKQTPEAGNIVTKETRISLVVNRGKQGQILDPKTLESVVLIHHELKTGFLKKHVRITSDMYGFDLNLVDRYSPGPENIYALVPGGIMTKVNIYIDAELVKTHIINPWKTRANPGEEQ